MNNDIKQPLNAALYARVSTNRQENEQTIESQLDEVKKRITEDGNTLLPQNIFIDDGWSGELIARPSLDLMRDAAKEAKFEVLYIYDRGRLSRTFAHQEIIIEELSDREIKFISLHDVQADSPETRVLQSMQGVFHEYERVKIAERMRRGKLYKARNGVIINGEALYGYKYVRNSPKEPVKCFVNEDEARTVNLVWNWFGNERLSLYQIQKNLYTFGIKPRRRKNDFWTMGPIRRLLKCDTYVTGKAYYNKSESVVSKHPLKVVKYKKIKKGSRRIREREDWIPFDVPRIINDYSLFEKNQKILAFNKDYKGKHKSHDYLLSGLIYCGCGCRRAGDGKSSTGDFYYRCTDRIRNKPFDRKCTSTGINATILDQTVWESLKTRLFNCSLIKKYAEKSINTLSKLSCQDIIEKQNLNDLIKKVEEEETRYSKAYGVGSLDFDRFQNLMSDAKRRKLSYNKQLSEMTNNVASIEIDISVDELVKEAMSVIKKLDFTNKFNIVHEIIDKVIVPDKTSAEVFAHIPLPAMITEKLGYETQGNYRWITKRMVIENRKGSQRSGRLIRNSKHKI